MKSISQIALIASYFLNKIEQFSLGSPQVPPKTRLGFPPLTPLGIARLGIASLEIASLEIASLRIASLCVLLSFWISQN